MLLEKTPESAISTLSMALQTLRTRWDHIKLRAAEKKVRLEDAENLACKFHEDLNGFIAWLTMTEQTFHQLRPVSRVLSLVTVQIEDHKTLQKDISAHREVMNRLEKTGTHLKYFSQKQDVILIKNLLVSTHHRWDKVVSRSADRTKQLDHGFKEARKVGESFGSFGIFVSVDSFVHFHLFWFCFKRFGSMILHGVQSDLIDVHMAVQVSYLERV